MKLDNQKTIESLAKYLETCFKDRGYFNVEDIDSHDLKAFIGDFVAQEYRDLANKFASYNF